MPGELVQQAGLARMRLGATEMGKVAARLGRMWRLRKVRIPLLIVVGYVAAAALLSPAAAHNADTVHIKVTIHGGRGDRVVTDLTITDPANVRRVQRALNDARSPSSLEMFLHPGGCTPWGAMNYEYEYDFVFFWHGRIPVQYLSTTSASCAPLFCVTLGLPRQGEYRGGVDWQALSDIKWLPVWNPDLRPDLHP